MTPLSDEWSVVQCLDAGLSECSGPVEYRMPLSGTGRAFPRCERHWELRLDEQQRIARLYPENPPSDFDPLDAGETWSDPDESPDPHWMNP